jgi:hypothetical protein
MSITPAHLWDMWLARDNILSCIDRTPRMGGILTFFEKDVILPALHMQQDFAQTAKNRAGVARR